MPLSTINNLRKIFLNSAKNDDEFNNIMNMCDEAIFNLALKNTENTDIVHTLFLILSAKPQSKPIVVTHVTIYGCNDNNIGKIKALADVTLNDAIQVRGIRVMDGVNGLFIGFPNDPFYKGDDFRSLVSPITRECREEIEEAVLNAYQEAIGDV